MASRNRLLGEGSTSAWFSLPSGAAAFQFRLSSAAEPLIVMLGALAVLGAYVWLARYGLDLVDEGYFLDLATRVQHGQLPYRDFDTYYTPGIFYLHAAVLTLFGADALPVRVVMVGIRVACALLIYRLARRLTPPVFASVPALLLAATGVLAGSNPGWPALLATLLMLDSIAQHEAGAGRWSLGLAGAAAGLAFLFKQNVGAFAILGALGYLLLRPRPQSGALLVLIRLLFAAGLAAAIRSFLKPALDGWLETTLWVPLVLTLLLLVWWTGRASDRARPTGGLRALAVDGGWLGAGCGLVTLAWLTPLLIALGPNGTPFGLFTGSVNQAALAFRLEALPRGAGVLALAAIWVPLAIAFRYQPVRSRLRWPFAIAALATLLIPMLPIRGVPADPLTSLPHQFPRLAALDAELGSLYLYLPTLGAWSGLALLARRLDSDARPPLLAWYLLVGTLAELAFYPRADAAHALLAGAPLVLVGACALARVHQVLAGGARRFVHAALFPTLLILPAGASLPHVYGYYLRLTHPQPESAYVPLGLDRATVLVPQHEAEPLRAAITFIRDRTVGGEPVFAYPLDPMANVLADRPNPTRFDHFLPGALSPDDMRQVVASLETARPRYVLWDHAAVVFWNTDKPNRTLSDYIWRCYQQVATFRYYLILERIDC